MSSTLLPSRWFAKWNLLVLMLLSVLAINDTVFSQENTSSNRDLIRVRIFTLKNITAEQAKEYLTASQIGDTVVVIPSTTALSVTGKPEELVQASTVLKLVDTSAGFDVQVIDWPQDKSMPNLDAVAAKLGTEYSVGSLLDGPVSNAAVKAVAGLNKNSKLLIVAPQGHLAKISETVKSFETESEIVDSAKIEIQPETTSQDNLVVITPPQTIIEQKEVAVDDIVFTEEPVVIEAGDIEISEPVKIDSQSKQIKTEDEMLGELMGELSQAAMAEKQAAQQLTEQPQKKPAQIVQPQTAVETKPEPVVNAAGAPKPVAPKPVMTEKIQRPTEVAAQPQTKDIETEDIESEVAEKAAIPSIDIPNGEETLELNLPEKLEIVALIDLVGKYLNLNYLYDDKEVTGNVTTKIQGKIKVKELYDMLETVLKFRGFVMSRKGNFVTIVPEAKAIDQDPTFSGDIQAGDVIVTSVFHLKHIGTEEAKKMLLGMKLGTAASITPIAETGTLIVTGYAFRMQRVEDLLELVDVPGPPKEFKLRVLKYTIAESIVPKIQELAKQLGTVDITIGITTPAPAATSRARRTRTPTPAKTPTPQTQDDGVFIDFDKRTNRVLMIGLESELAAVNQIIDSLDVPQQDLRVINEYEIQYIDIDTVVGALKDLGVIDSAGTNTSGSRSRSSSASRTSAARKPTTAAPAASSVTTGPDGSATLDQPQVVMLESTNSLLVNATPEQHLQIARIISYVDREPLQNAIPYRIYRLENQEPEALAEVLNSLIEKTIKDKEGKIQQTIKLEDDIAIVPDESTFSLIVYASKRNQEWIGNLIQTLDQRRPQVLIDVSLVEIQKNDAFEYDLNLVANATSLVTGNVAVTGSQLVSSATGTNLEGGFNLQDSEGNNLGAVKGFYSNDKIQALLTLIDSKGYGRILAQPKVLVNDNEQGLIKTTEKTYREEVTVTWPGDPPTQQETSTWTPYEAKIELTITPQISEGDLLRLEVEMVREDFVDTTAGPPDYVTSNVNTVVTVPDGSTIILGGLTKLNQAKGGNKVPLLGDIPLAGSLFRSVDNSNEERWLYIFVKANILRPDMGSGLRQLKEISRDNQIEFERMEDKFQKYESVPGMKSEPVEPVHVLRQPVEETEEVEVLDVLEQKE